MSLFKIELQKSVVGLYTKIPKVTKDEEMIKRRSYLKRTLSYIY